MLVVEGGRIVGGKMEGEEDELVANGDDKAERVPRIRRPFRSQMVDVFVSGGEVGTTMFGLHVLRCQPDCTRSRLLSAGVLAYGVRVLILSSVIGPNGFDTYFGTTQRNDSRPSDQVGHVKTRPTSWDIRQPSTSRYRENGASPKKVLRPALDNPQHQLSRVAATKGNHTSWPDTVRAIAMLIDSLQLLIGRPQPPLTLLSSG